MHILYLDEAGTQAESENFVLAGLAVFERETYFLAQALDGLQNKYLPNLDEPAVFHATDLHKPDQFVRPPFDILDRNTRMGLLRDICVEISRSNARFVRCRPGKEVCTTAIRTNGASRKS